MKTSIRSKLFTVALVIILVITITAFGIFGFLSFKTCQSIAAAADDINSQIIAMTEITEGTIVDKRIESTGFFTKEPAYYLYIAGEYKSNDGEIVDSTVRILVDKEIYQGYAVGEYFDSRNP